MNTLLRTGLFALALSASTAAFAAAKTYQVTGPVLEVTDTTITVEKGKEKWVLLRDASTKVTGGELKVGEKVTVTYTMTATDIEVKPGKASAGEGKAEKKKK
jgi:hypothetical protein